MKKKQRGTIIFDFDGTIADSFSVALDIFYSFGHIQPLAKNEVARLRGMALPQIATELKVPKLLIPLMLIRGRRIMRRRMEEILIVPGMDEAIRRLSKTHKLFILSSNSVENVDKFLNQHGLRHYFEAVYGGAGLLSKAKKLQKVIVNNVLDRSTTWYVGDESRDVQAAHKCRLKAVAVSWGYNNKRALSRQKPEVLVSTVDDLIRCF